eukprot:scaffold6070_cov295-Pinguiococcus_pyrenoidosus.AAC.13
MCREGPRVHAGLAEVLHLGRQPGRIPSGLSPPKEREACLEVFLIAFSSSLAELLRVVQSDTGAL